MIKDILTQTFVGIVSGILVICGISLIFFVLLKLVIIPFALEHLPQFLKSLI